GDYQLKVRALDAGDRPGAWSDTYAYRVTQLDHGTPEILSPLNGSSILLSEEQPLLSLIWQSTGEQSSYLVKVVDQKNDETIVTKKALDPKYALPLEP